MDAERARARAREGGFVYGKVEHTQAHTEVSERARAAAGISDGGDCQDQEKPTLECLVVH